MQFLCLRSAAVRCSQRKLRAVHGGALKPVHAVPVCVRGTCHIMTPSHLAVAVHLQPPRRVSQLRFLPGPRLPRMMHRLRMHLHASSSEPPPVWKRM